MRYRILGQRTGLKVSEFALGSGMFGQTWGHGATKEQVHEMINAYADAGGNFIDTADNYQHGEAEILVGEIVAGRRDDFVITSKYSRGASDKDALVRLGCSRKTMVQAVEASLRRLKTDRIDIYFVHMDDRVTPIEEVARGMDDLVRAGKIVYAGVSNYAAWRIARGVTLADLRGWSPFSVVQLEHNLIERCAERELIRMAEGLGLGVMAWSPMAGGLLTGKYRRGEKGRITEMHGVSDHYTAHHDTVLDAVDAVAVEHGLPASLIAIAWVVAKGAIPILGSRTPAQLREILGAAQVMLSPAQIDVLDSASRTSLGYPHDLLNSDTQRAIMTGGRYDQVDWPATTVA
jgi:aryl-alcohol dehydrogenase-like predicted oxidoreductase